MPISIIGKKCERIVCLISVLSTSGTQTKRRLSRTSNKNYTHTKQSQFKSSFFCTRSYEVYFPFFSPVLFEIVIFTETLINTYDYPIFLYKRYQLLASPNPEDTDISVARIVHWPSNSQIPNNGRPIRKSRHRSLVTSLSVSLSFSSGR